MVIKQEAPVKTGASQKGVRKTMKLTEIISENEIKINLEAEDKFEAIEELVDLLISEHEISLRDRDAVIDVVFQRERSMSTGVGEGIAIPHGSIECIDDLVGAIGVSSKGIDFDSIDGAPVYIVLLLLVPKTSFGKHIKTLARISRILCRENIRSNIRSAESPEIVFRIFDEAERERLQELIRLSPRQFGHEISIWTLALLAKTCQSEEIASRPVRQTPPPRRHQLQRHHRVAAKE